METKHKSSNNSKLKVVLSLLLIFAFMFSLPFISSKTSNDYETIPNKININNKIIETGKTYKDNNNLIQKEKKNQYDASNVIIKSHTSNTINTETAIINNNYVSVKSYDKKNAEPYEITFNVGTDGVLYSVYKSDLTDISKKKVKETGVLYANVYSENGKVTINTNGFSTLILSIPDVVIPFFNTARINLDMYFDQTVTPCDTYDITYQNPNTLSYDTLTYGNSASFDFDFNLSTYTDGFTNHILEITEYENICNSTSCDYDNTLTVDCKVSTVSQASDSFKFYTYEHYLDYFVGVDVKRGLHKDMVDYLDFNQNPNHPDQLEPFAYSRFDPDNIYTNTPTTWAGGYGKIGGAYDYDGSTDYVGGFGDNYDITGAFTVNAWVKTNSQTTQFVVNKDGSEREYILYLEWTGTILRPLLTIWRSDTPQQAFGTSDLSDNNYHMVTYVNDGVDLKIYVDGVLDSGTSGNGKGGSVDSGTDSFEIGRSTQGNNNYFNGNIDEVGIFNKGLSITEIAYLYNSGLGREFHTLNNPSNLGLGFCFSHDVAYCYNSNEQIYYGELPQGNTFINLDNMFNAQSDTTQTEDYYFYTYNVEFYDYTTEGTLNLTHGEAYLGPYYDLALNTNDQLTINYHDGSPDETVKGFYGIVYATNDLGYTDVEEYNIFFTQLEAFPPNEIKPISIDWNTATGFNLSAENISLNLNSYYGNWTNVRVTYDDYSQLFNDSIIYNIALQADFADTIQTNIGNLTVTLDPTQVLNNVIIDIIPTNDSITYSGVFTVNVSNSLGSIYRDFTIVYGEVSEPTIPTQVLPNLTMNFNEIEIYDFKDYYQNISNLTLYFDYGNDSNVYPNYMLNDTEYALFGSNDFDLQLYGNDRIIVESFGNNITQLIEVDIEHLNGSISQDKFYIIITPIISMTETQTYLANLGSLISGLFPNASSLSSIDALSIVIGVILIASILIITMLWNKLGKTSIYIALGVDILLFLMFAGLDYISTGFLILIGLLLLGLSYLKIRS